MTTTWLRIVWVPPIGANAQGKNSAINPMATQNWDEQLDFKVLVQLFSKRWPFEAMFRWRAATSVDLEQMLKVLNIEAEGQIAGTLLEDQEVLESIMDAAFLINIYVQIINIINHITT